MNNLEAYCYAFRNLPFAAYGLELVDDVTELEIGGGGIVGCNCNGGIDKGGAIVVDAIFTIGGIIPTLPMVDVGLVAIGANKIGDCWLKF